MLLFLIGGGRRIIIVFHSFDRFVMPFIDGLNKISEKQGFSPKNTRSQVYWYLHTYC